MGAEARGSWGYKSVPQRVSRGTIIILGMSWVVNDFDRQFLVAAWYIFRITALLLLSTHSGRRVLGNYEPSLCKLWFR
jgi:hypothetical protein